MTRESPAIEVDGSLSGQRVVAVLKRLGGAHGLPKILFVDNGPEFTSKALDAWAHQHGVKLACSRPGTPTDTPFIEAFNARFREECVNQHWFASLEEARPTIEAWRVDYNTERPHTALHCQAPAVYKAAWLQSQGIRTASDEPARWTKGGVRTSVTPVTDYVAQFSGSGAMCVIGVRRHPAHGDEVVPSRLARTCEVSTS
jgi:putative transposase